LTPNSVSLNEECGLVNYIFSDKTGTLTCNKMQFKFCVIGETCYQYIRNESNEGDEKEQNFRKEENIIPFHKYKMLQSVKNKDSKFNHKLNSPYIMSSENNQKIKLVLENNNLLIEQFWFALSLCHTCSVEIKEDGIEEYSCISPDSIELVKAARDQGWKFTKSEASSIKRINFGMTEGKIIDFERLELIEFSSDRKRETIIVKEKNGADDIIKLYCKGADSIIEKRLSQNTPQNILAQCKYYVNKFSSLGFRTLFIAMKILSQEEYDTFSNLLKEAQMSLEDKDKKVAEVYDTIEKNLFLLGATIVEDKLQDLVPETIRDLRLAKIKIWVLTGDKMNTAYNIGLSCNLISKKMKIFNICGKEEKKDSNYKDINKDEREKVIFDFAKEFQGYKGQFNSLDKPSFGILIDEKALLTVSEGEDVKKIFLDIAKDAEAVICCRVSPLQKSQVVKMMKEYDNNAITLAIGDGGNDVPMIMESHIGVGIYGEEGLRAVQSSDYAIGEFKILRELLFTHGRMNYVKNAECIHYFFYKNFILTFNQFIYGFYCNFTGQTILDDWFITLYNLLFTSLPLGTKAILDKDLCRDDGIIVYKLLPFIYKENRDNPVFTIFKFFLNLLKGLLFSLINCFIVIYSVHNIHINKKGFIPGLWFMSADLYTNILIIVTSTLLITTRYHTWIHFAILGVVTFISYIVFLIMVQNLSIFNSVGTMGQAFQSSTMWFNIILISGTCGLIDFFILSFNYYFRPDIISTLQRIYSQKGEKINTKEGLPKYILDKIDIYDNIENKIEEKNIEVKDVPTKNEEKKSKNTKEEDENSKDILIHNHKTEIINDLKAEKNSKNLQIETIPEDFNSYFNDDFSEKISQEKNLDFHEEKYFVEPWNFNQKIAKNH
jgi:phospholipid-transporting ATPase